MKPLSVEDGIVCEFCGTHCYQGAEHNTRVEDNARFDDPKPAAVPVEERTLRKTCYCNEIWCPTCYPPVPTAKPIPEERTAEMELLMASLRASAAHALGVAADHGINPDCFPVALATAPNILKLLDHIEGKAK